MATPPIMPVGFIKERTSDGAVFTLAQSRETVSLKTGDHITVWARNLEKKATARVLGVVANVGDSTGTFTIIRMETEGPWPSGSDSLEPGSPIYRAIKGTYQPDPDS